MVKVANVARKYTEAYITGDWNKARELWFELCDLAEFSDDEQVSDFAHKMLCELERERMGM